jgi:hypothetical protein
MENNKGFAPIIIILAIVVLGGVAYAVVPKTVLKNFFEKGDKPTEQQFSDTIDSALNLQDDGISAAKKEYNPAKEYVTGDTVVKNQPTYQAKVLTQTQTEFKLDVDQPVTFRWTPIVPKPQEPMTYRLKVWQLMQGQNGTTAMRTNQPIVTKDVDNIAEATLSGIYTGPCRPPYLCDFIWSVEVVSKTNTGTGASGSATGSATEVTPSTDGKKDTGTTQ